MVIEFVTETESWAWWLHWNPNKNEFPLENYRGYGMVLVSGMVQQMYANDYHKTVKRPDTYSKFLKKIISAKSSISDSWFTYLYLKSGQIP